MESDMGEECSLDKKTLTCQYIRPYISIDLFVGEPISSVEIHDN